jgi:hypothetical protein
VDYIKVYVGFDEEGAQQLKHKLVGTSKWIGTAGEATNYMLIFANSNINLELYVAFISRSIPYVDTCPLLSTV